MISRWCNFGKTRPAAHVLSLGCAGQRFTTLRRRRDGRLSPVLLQLEPDFALGSQSLHDSVRRFTLEEDGGRRLHDFCRALKVLNGKIGLGTFSFLNQRRGDGHQG